MASSAPLTTSTPAIFDSEQAVNIAADDSYDSSYEDEDIQSELTSVSSSVYDFVYENGRRYHSKRFNQGNYFLPNDEGEQDRLDLYHHIFLTLLGGELYKAPLGELHRVLDVGTGTGIWAIDMADKHPEAEVIGTDISPIQPSWLPQNCRFEVDDMEESWTYTDDYFDYIHMRSLSGSFRDWDQVIRQTYKHLKPGGWIEFQDHGMEGFFSNGEPTTGINKPIPRWCDLLAECADLVGRPLIVAPTMQERLTKAGFINVAVHTAIWPFGGWPKDRALKKLGIWCKMGAEQTIESYALKLLCGVKKWSADDVKQFSQDVIKDMSIGKYYCQVWFVYGQKPTAKDLAAKKQ